MENHQDQWGRSALALLLAAHRCLLWGLLWLAMAVALLPVVVVCDSGQLLSCIRAGVLMGRAVAAGALGTVGIAIQALRKPGKLSQGFLALYSVALIVLRFLSQASDFNLTALDALAALGALTMVCVMFLGAGRRPAP
jgi:hypothetical protein